MGKDQRIQNRRAVRFGSQPAGNRTHRKTRTERNEEEEREIEDWSEEAIEKYRENLETTSNPEIQIIEE